MTEMPDNTANGRTDGRTHGVTAKGPGPQGRVHGLAPTTQVDSWRKRVSRLHLLD